MPIGELLLKVKIPALPPTVNHAVGFGRKRFWDSAEKKSFKAIAIPLIRHAFSGVRWYEGLCALDIALFDSSYRRWDIDNRVKVIQDCIGSAHGGAGVIKDDTQIYDLHVHRHKCSKLEKQYVIVCLYEYFRSEKGA